MKKTSLYKILLQKSVTAHKYVIAYMHLCGFLSVKVMKL